MTDLLTDPEVYAHLVDLVVGIASLAMTLASLCVARFAKVKIDEKHMRALHEAVITWAENAMRRGVTEANTDAVAELEAYLKASVPGAYAVLRPMSGVLFNLANRYLRAT